MDPLTLLLIGASIGAVKSEAIDRPREKRQRKLAAETQRLSPWTGMKADPIKEADPLASALAFGTAGAQLGMGLQQAELNKTIADRMASGSGYMQVNANTGGPYSLMPQVYGQNPFGLSNPYSGMSTYGY